MTDDLEKLLADVRTTIMDNKQFLEKLVNEKVDGEMRDETEASLMEEDFEEL